MAKNDKARAECRALPYLEPVARIDCAVADLGAAFLSSGSQAPARAAVEARSDLSFTQHIATAVAAECPPETAAGVALTVLTKPSLAVWRDLGGGERRIVQSVVLERLPDDFELQVVVDLVARAEKPGAVTVENVECRLVDLKDSEDACRLVEAVERMWGEFPMAAVKVPEPFPLRDWAWLGDPSHAGVLDTPPDWKQQVERAGAVYGVKPLVVESAGQLRAWSVQDRVENAFVLNGAKWAASFPVGDADKDVEVTKLGVYGDTFAAVLGEVREALLREALAANAGTPPSRDLEPGEVVYHRKVGNSRKFDRFDTGSSTPCAHGADQFKGWVGDKAVKGMARRYDNFTSDMLIHCDKYPNCGMYGVDAARGGLRAPTDDE